MQYSDGYKENTYLTWKGEKYRVTPEFESLSFYDERDGDVSLYCKPYGRLAQRRTLSLLGGFLRY